MKRKLSLPSFSRMASRSILMYSVGRGISRWPGPTQCPTTPAPSMSPTNCVAFAVPNEKGGARAAAAVDFHVFLFAVGGDFDFVLQNSSRPEHANDVGLGGLSEADGEDKVNSVRDNRTIRRSRISGESLPRTLRLWFRWHSCCRPALSDRGAASGSCCRLHFAARQPDRDSA